MATITLDYNSKNVQAQKALDYILSMGVFKAKTYSPIVRKSRLKSSLEDVEKGKVFFLAGPKQL